MPTQKQRFRETVPIKQTDLGTGIPERTMSLVEKLHQFDNQLENFVGKGFELRAENEAQAGAEEAEATPQRDEEGKLQQPPFREEGIFDRHRTRAYNATLADAYKESQKNDNRENLSRIFLENSMDVAGYTASAEAYKTGVLKNVDPYIQADVGQELERSISIGKTKVQENQMQANLKTAQGIFQVSYQKNALEASRLAREGDTLGSGEALFQAITNINKLTIGKDKKEELIRGVERETTEQTFRYAFDQLPIEETEAEINKVEDAVPGGWKPDEWDTFIKSARTDLTHRKTVERAQAGVVSDAEEENLFRKLVKNELTETDIETAALDDPAKRLRWYGVMNQNTDRAKAARKAEKDLIRQERNDLYTMETRAKAQIESVAEAGMDTLYSNMSLTIDMIDTSNASTAMKRIYRDMVKKQTKAVKDRAIELNTLMLDAEILNNLGGWTDPQLYDFVDKGLIPDDVYIWQQRNKETKNDPNNFRHDVVYKQGLRDLQNAKENLLFIGGGNEAGKTEKQLLNNDNRNTGEYLKVLRQFERECSQPGADVDAILMRLKKPYLGNVSQTYMERLTEGATKAITEAWDKTAKKTPKTEAKPKAAAKEKRAAPTREEFLKAAKAGNKDYSDQELNDYYDKEYGGQ
jgi:hypothetical protein